MDPAHLTEAISAAAHALAVDQVTAEVVLALRARGVEPVLLKGPTFARWLYPAGPLRGYADSDLLVAPGDQDTAADVLVTLGFTDPMATALPHELDDHSRTFHRRRPGGADAEVDLHFTLAGCRAAPAQVWSALTRDAVQFDVAGTSVTALSTTARMLHVVLHVAQGARADAQPMADLERLMATTDRAAWPAVAALAAEVAALAAFATGLDRASAGRAILGELGIDPAARSTSERLRGGTTPPMSLRIAELFEREHRHGVARELVRELVPSPAFLRLSSPLARRGRIGLFAAYLWRPWSLLIRLGPALRAYLRARTGDRARRG